MAGKDSAPPLYPGDRPCIKCRKTFASWCKKRNQICPPCAKDNNRMPRVYDTGLVRSAESGAFSPDD